MRQQVYSLPALIRDQFWTLEARTRKVLTTPEIFSVRSVLITGSGDSQIAGVAAAPAFTELAGILPYALPSMQAARYVAPALGAQPPNTPLVIAVSSSGEVARVVEAVHAFNRQGALTLAVTAQPDSRLGMAAQKSIVMDLPPFVSAPGVRSYVLSLLTLQLLAIRLAEVRGRITMDVAHAARLELASSSEVLAQALPALDDGSQRLAAQWCELGSFEMLGSGPHAGTAAYGAAKLLEAVGCPACAVDIEEWNHLNYFTQQPERIGTLLLADPAFRSFRRACEVAGYLQTLGRPYAVLGNMAPTPAGLPPERIFAIPNSLREVFSPVVYSAVLALFAAYLNEAAGAVYGRGSAGAWRDSQDGNAVRNSQIEYAAQPHEVNA